MGILYAATILTSLCGVLFGPAISATIPGLVKKEELVKANSLNHFSRAATMILGPVLGAFLLGTTGYFGAFFINGIAFLLSALSETFIRFPEVVGMKCRWPRQESVYPDISRGIHLHLAQCRSQNAYLLCHGAEFPRCASA